ncbi:hypothetical protein [Qipengyuania marisflavi]|nr:hypothetical protein [Qipengyuania marisflavi]
MSRFNPAGGIADFWHEFTRPNPYRWPILLASFAATGTMMYSFTQERVYLPPDKPQVNFITTFAPDRTLEEIRASNLANQKIKEKREAEQAEREEAAKEAYRALGRATGLDVDAMEAEARADKAREDAAEKARMDALTAQMQAADNAVATTGE